MSNPLLRIQRAQLVDIIGDDPAAIRAFEELFKQTDVEGGPIGEAPQDDTPYSRENAGWVEASKKVDQDLNTTDSPQFVNVTSNVDGIVTGQIIFDLLTKSAGYIITDSDPEVLSVITGGTNRTITLPTLAANQGKIHHIIKVDDGAGIMTVEGEGAETINGQDDMAFPSQYNYLRVIGLAATWLVLGFAATFDAGWIDANNDWTDVNFAVAHNLGVNIADINIKFLISTDGTDATSFEILEAANMADTSGIQGFIIYQDTKDQFTIHTGSAGIAAFTEAGAGVKIDTEPWYYRIPARRVC